MGRVLNFLTLIFLLLIGLYLLPVPMEANISGQQAISFLKGRVYLEDTPYLKTQDVAYYEGKSYSPFPPMPALLMLPFIAVMGAKAPLILLMMPVTFITLWAWLEIFKKLPNTMPILIFGMLFGTAFPFLLLFSDRVWHSAHLIAFFFATLAIYTIYMDALTVKHCFFTGLFISMSFLSRQFMIFSLPFFLTIIYEQKGRYSLYGALLVGLIPGILIYLLYNWLRFDHLLTTGYEYIAYGDFQQPRIEKYGLFSPHYLFFNLHHFLFSGFYIEFGGAETMTPQDISLYGTGFLFASPFVILAFYSDLPMVNRYSIWMICLAMFACHMFYHNNGSVQLNSQRFALDYLPFLMLLIGTGAKRLPPSLVRGLVAWSVIMNCYAFFVAAMI